MTAGSVLIADDHPATRAGVRVALEEAGFAVCAEVATAAAAAAEAKRHRPDVCVLDVRMPGGGIRAAAEIAAALPSTRIVMLTVSRDDADLLDALRAGAVGYLLKDIDRSRLGEALRRALRGESPMPGTLVARLVDEFRSRDRRRRFLRRGRSVELRPREWEVLQLLHEGLTTSEIAARLFIEEVTVRTHVSALLRKLEVPDRAAAVRLLDER